MRAPTQTHLPRCPKLDCGKSLGKGHDQKICSFFFFSLSYVLFFNVTQLSPQTTRELHLICCLWNDLTDTGFWRPVLQFLDRNLRCFEQNSASENMFSFHAKYYNFALTIPQQSFFPYKYWTKWICLATLKPCWETNWEIINWSKWVKNKLAHRTLPNR